MTSLSHSGGHRFKSGQAHTVFVLHFSQFLCKDVLYMCLLLAITNLEILSYILPIELPLWIALSLAYGLYLLARMESGVRWAPFTALSFAEIAASILLWEIPGIIAMALTVFPLWLHMALKLQRTGEGKTRL